MRWSGLALMHRAERRFPFGCCWSSSYNTNRSRELLEDLCSIRETVRQGRHRDQRSASRILIVEDTDWKCSTATDTDQRLDFITRGHYAIDGQGQECNVGCDGRDGQQTGYSSRSIDSLEGWHGSDGFVQTEASIVVATTLASKSELE